MQTTVSSGRRAGLRVSRMLLGAGFALLGVALLEGLLCIGMRPFGPLGWPGLGMLAGTAVGGVSGLVGGSAILLPYYLVNLAHPERFPQFYSSPVVNSASWCIALALLAAVALAVRPRVLRAAAAEAELLTRGLYEEALRESEQRLQLITDNVPGLVAYIDTEQHYRFNNRAYEDWLGLARTEITGRTVREVWGVERYAMMAPNIEQALRGERVSHDYALLQGGVERQILASYVPDFDAAGNVKGVFVLGSDVTQLAAARAELRAEHQRLEMALDGSSVALWDADLRSGRVYLSDAWAGIVGAPPGESTVTLEELVALVHPDDLEPARRASLDAMKGVRPAYAIEHRVRARSGEWKWILSRGRVTERDPASGRALRMIGTNLDITDRKRMEDAMQSIAQSDALTGLANRRQLLDRSRIALARSRRSGLEVAVLFLDLDRFKQVNDSLGHAAGDELLRQVAVRLRTCVRETDCVARLGGDEFVVLLEDVRERQNAIRVAEKIIEAVRLPVRIDDREAMVGTSVGISFGRDCADDGELLKRADGALYAAKSAGRGRYSVAA